jgi:hypothetical protein
MFKFVALRAVVHAAFANSLLKLCAEWASSQMATPPNRRAATAAARFKSRRRQRFSPAWKHPEIDRMAVPAPPPHPGSLMFNTDEKRCHTY